MVYFLSLVPYFKFQRGDDLIYPTLKSDTENTFHKGLDTYLALLETFSFTFCPFQHHPTKYADSSQSCYSLALNKLVCLLIPAFLRIYYFIFDTRMFEMLIFP